MKGTDPWSHILFHKHGRVNGREISLIYHYTLFIRFRKHGPGVVIIIGMKRKEMAGQMFDDRHDEN